MPRNRPAGMTLVELLVVIALISILAGLLLPTVQYAREAARRTQCVNNLKQIGLALANYHDMQRTFPPAAIRPRGFLDNGRDNPRTTWLISILPMMEQVPLYNSYNPRVPVTAAANRALRRATVPDYVCPSDSGTGTPFQPLLGVEFARGSYGANYGSASWGLVYWKQQQYRGVMGQNAAQSIAYITDGTSHTVSVAELRSQPSPKDNRGVWAFDAPGSSSVGLDCDIHCRGINDDPVFDWIPYCAPLGSGLNCHFQNSADSNAGPRSMHAGGANVLLCDGSVHFASDSVARPVLRRLFASQDGGVVDDF